MTRLSFLLQQKEKNLTKKQAAEIMGVRPMYYARFENNNLLPTKRNTGFFAVFLEMDEDELWRVIENDRVI